jgi:hypothetical protein
MAREGGGGRGHRPPATGGTGVGAPVTAAAMDGAVVWGAPSAGRPPLPRGRCCGATWGVGEGKGACQGEKGEREGRERGCALGKNGEVLWTTMEGSSPEKMEFVGAEKKIVD